MANPNPSPATRWKPGQTGNRGGSSKKERTIMEIARNASPEGMVAVIEMARNNPDDSIRLAAWKIVFERAFGRPRQEVAIDGSVQHSFVIALPAGTPLSDADDWQLKWGNKDIDLIEDGVE